MSSLRSPDGRCAKCGLWSCHHLYGVANNTQQSTPHICPPYSEETLREDERQRVIELLEDLRTKELATVDTTTRQAYAVEVLNEAIAAVRELS